MSFICLGSLGTVAMCRLSPVPFFTWGNISSKVLMGIIRMLSASPPRKLPFFSSRPTTLKAMPFTSTVRPMGSFRPKSTLAVSGPMTQVREAWVMSASTRKRPSCMKLLLAGA